MIDNLVFIHALVTKQLNPDVDLIIPQFHIEMLKTYINNDRLQLLVCPVGFAKSTTLKSFAIYSLFFDPKCKYILYVSSTASKVAEQFTSFNRILNNKENQKTFNYKILETNQTGITLDFCGVKKRIYGVAREQDISGTNFQGARPHIILIDDLEELSTANSTHLTEKIIEWLSITLISRLPTLSTGKVRMIGTNLTKNSIVNRILQNLPDKTGNLIFQKWKQYKYQALDKQGKSIWEQRFSTEILLNEQKSNPVAFASNYMNEPLDSTTSLVKLHDLRYFDNFSIPAINQISIYADLAHTAKSTSDYVAIGVIGKSFDNQYYLLDYILDHLDPEKSKHALIGLYIKYKDKNVIRVAYDQTGQDYWTEAVKKIATKEYNISIPIEGIKTNKDKVSEFNSIINVFKANNLFFCQKFITDNEARNQLLLFPNNKHDDFVDMLTHCIKVFEYTDPNQKKLIELNTETLEQIKIWDIFNPFI